MSTCALYHKLLQEEILTIQNNEKFRYQYTPTDRKGKYMAKTCGICGKEIGMMSNKIVLKDAVLCTSCAKSLPRLSLGQTQYTLAEAKDAIRRIEERKAAESEGYVGATPEYVVLQVVLKEVTFGTGSGNLSELEAIINRQAAKSYRLHTISTTSSGSKGFGGGDRIQATMVFEKLM